MVEGLALLRTGRAARGAITALRPGIDGWKSRGGHLNLPYLKAALAEALALDGRPRLADCACSTNAWSRSSGLDGTNACGFPRRLRLKGWVLMRQGKRDGGRGAAARVDRVGAARSRRGRGSCAARPRWPELLIDSRPSATPHATCSARSTTWFTEGLRHPRPRDRPGAAGRPALTRPASHHLDGDAGHAGSPRPYHEEPRIAARCGIGGDGRRNRRCRVAPAAPDSSFGGRALEERRGNPAAAAAEQVGGRGTRRTERPSLLRSVIEIVARWPGFTAAARPDLGERVRIARRPAETAAARGRPGRSVPARPDRRDVVDQLVHLAQQRIAGVSGSRVKRRAPARAARRARLSPSPRRGSTPPARRSTPPGSRRPTERLARDPVRRACSCTGESPGRDDSVSAPGNGISRRSKAPWPR